MSQSDGDVAPRLPAMERDRLLRSAVMGAEAALERGPNHGLVCLEPRHLVALVGAALGWLRLESERDQASEAADLPPALAQGPGTDVAAATETSAPENAAPAGAGTVGLRRVWAGDGVSLDVRGDVVVRAHVELPAPGVSGAVVELDRPAVRDALRQHAYRFCADWLVEWGEPPVDASAVLASLELRPDVPPEPLFVTERWRLDELAAGLGGAVYHHSGEGPPLAQDWPGRRIEAVQQPEQAQYAARAMTDALNDAPHVAVLAAALLGTEGRVDVPPDDDECVGRAVRMWVQIVRELREEGPRR